jgi:restriction endonuclease fold toxin 5 of polymorphic toxin system
VLPFATMRQLYPRGAHCQGLAVDAEGVMLGPDCVLVHRLPGGGYRSARPDAIAHLARAVFDDDVRLRRLPIVLSGIVAALDRGDLVKAQLLGLEIPLDRLDAPRLQRLGHAADLLKDGFDPNQLRDAHGQWAREGGAATRVTAAFASLLSRLSAAALAGLRVLAAAATSGALEAVAFLGIVCIPTNRSLISRGTLPDRPDLSYEFDQGANRLRLFRQDGDSRSLVFEGRPDADGIIRDNDGHAVGRKLDDSVVIIDPDTLPGAGTRNDDGRPKLCPDPGDDRGGQKNEKDIQYQMQISGLGRGLAVRLPSRSTDPKRDAYVVFDGCRESDGTMLEAKSTGYLAMMRDKPFFWREIMMPKIYKQAENQVTAAAGRPIEWHFAEKEVADYVRAKFESRRLPITVIYTPPLPRSPQ